MLDKVTPINIRYRQETIISLYRQKFGEKMPVDKSYWTVANDYYCNKQNGLLKNCELDQVVSSGLISTHQFHGVSIDKNIIENNRKISGPSWHHGLFSSVLKKSDLTEEAPGIVRYCSTKMVDACANELSEILDILTKKNINDILVIFTCSLTTGSNQTSLSDISDGFSKDPVFMSVMNTGNWTKSDQAYIHHQSSTMATVYFWR